MKKIGKMLLSILLCVSMICPSVLAETGGTSTPSSGTSTPTSGTNSGVQTTVDGKVVTPTPVPGAEATAVKPTSLAASTFQSWCYTQMYSRMFTTAGSMLMSTAKLCSDNEAFQYSLSIINSLVFGGSDMGSDVAEIKEMCKQMLNELEQLEQDIQTSHNSISEILANQNMKDVFKSYEDAWTADVETPMSSEAAPNYHLAHEAFKEYMQYARSYANNESLDILGRVATQDDVQAKRENLFHQFAAMSKSTYDVMNTTLDEDEYYKVAMFLSDDIDKQIITVLSKLLENMYGSNSANSQTRYIDTAAQVAYYSLPYSSQQAEFVDNAVQRQLNEIGIVLMVYQEFQAQRAEYFQELYKSQENKVDDETLENYRISLNNFYVQSRNRIAPYFSGTATNGGIKGVVDKWLNSKIYLEGQLNGSYIYLDSYVRDESTKDVTLQITDDSYLTQTDWEFYVEEAEKGYLNINSISANPQKSVVEADFVTQTNNTFRRQAIVVGNGGTQEASVVPVYVMTADSLGKEENFYLKEFDYNYTNVEGLLDCHVPTTDYYNLVRGIYSDGLNTFKCLSSTAQLQVLLENNFYAALRNSPYDYLSPLLTNQQYKDNPVYLLLNDSTQGSEHGGGTTYAVFKTLDISNGKSYTAGAEWKYSAVDQYNLQDDRDEDENQTDSMYAVMLMNGEEEYRSNIQTTVIGTGKYEVSYESAAPYDATSVGVETTEEGIRANAGKSVTINVTLSDQQTIREVYVEYFDDAGMTHSYGKEKLVSDYATNLVKYGEDGNAQIHFRVPYAHVKLTIYTECAEYDNGICPTCKEYEAPSTTIIDEKEYYEISNAGQLYWFAALVNNDQTHAKFDKSNTSANAILRDNVYLEGITDPWPSIGMHGEQYSGTFDGDGYGIFNLNANVDRDDLDIESENPGLFTVIGAEGKVQNLIVDDAFVYNTCWLEESEDDYGNTAVIAAENYGSIDSVLVRNSVIDSNIFVHWKGGIAGKNGTGGKITNCAVVDTDICAYLYSVGGICAKNDGTVCWNHTYQCNFLPYDLEDEHGAIIAEEGDNGKSFVNYYYTESDVVSTYGTSQTKNQFKNQEVYSTLKTALGNNDETWYQTLSMDYPVPVKENFNECTITYVLNGGEYTDNPTIVAIGETIRLHHPIRNGYEFEGWYSDPDFQTRYVAVNGSQQRALTLYAKWGDFADYTITYELDGGTNAEENPASYRIDSEDITFADALREGYKFLGWFKDEACTQKVTSIPKGSYGDIVLYAGWELIPTLDKEGDHYVISSYENLMAMAYLCENEPETYTNANYVQTQNITCGMGSWEIAIGSEEHPFNGTYDGQGKYIVGLRPTEQVSGLFGVIGTEGCVKNLYVADFDYEKPAEYAGGLAGINYGIIDSCGSGVMITLNIFLERENGEKVPVAELNSVIRGTKVAGGLVAINEGIVQNSSSRADVVIEASDGAETYAGGLTGKNMGTMKNIFNTGSITGSTYAGGIAGSHSAGTLGVEAVIQYGYNAGTVSGTYVGGIVGLCKNTNIKDMYYASTNDTATYSLEDASLGVTKMELADMKKSSFTNELNDLIAGTEYATWMLNAKANNGYPKFEQDDSETQIITGVHQGVFGTISGSDAKNDTSSTNTVDTGDKSHALMWMMVGAVSLMLVCTVLVMNKRRKR